MEMLNGQAELEKQHYRKQEIIRPLHNGVSVVDNEA